MYYAMDFLSFRAVSTQPPLPVFQLQLSPHLTYFAIWVDPFQITGARGEMSGE